MHRSLAPIIFVHKIKRDTDGTLKVSQSKYYVRKLALEIEVTTGWWRLVMLFVLFTCAFCVCVCSCAFIAWDWLRRSDLNRINRSTEQSLALSVRISRHTLWKSTDANPNSNTLTVCIRTGVFHCINSLTCDFTYVFAWMRKEHLTPRVHATQFGFRQFCTIHNCIGAFAYDLSMCYSLAAFGIIICFYVCRSHFIGN